MLEKTRSRAKHKIDKAVLEIGTNPRVEDAGHLKKIRELPCCNCYGTQTVQAAHVRLGSNSGMGKKPNDERTLPLCMACHHLQHAKGEIYFWGKRLPEAINLTTSLYGASRDQMEILVYQFYRSGK